MYGASFPAASSIRYRSHQRGHRLRTPGIDPKAFQLGIGITDAGATATSPLARATHATVTFVGVAVLVLSLIHI